jgi:hypothetical protein
MHFVPHDVMACDIEHELFACSDFVDGLTLQDSDMENSTVEVVKKDDTGNGDDDDAADAADADADAADAAAADAAAADDDDDAGAGAGAAVAADVAVAVVAAVTAVTAVTAVAGAGAVAADADDDDDDDDDENDDDDDDDDDDDGVSDNGDDDNHDDADTGPATNSVNYQVSVDKVLAFLEDTRFQLVRDKVNSRLITPATLIRMTNPTLSSSSYASDLGENVSSATQLLDFEMKEAEKEVLQAKRQALFNKRFIPSTQGVYRPVPLK